MAILLNKSSEIEDAREMPNSEIEKYIQLAYKRESNRQILRERLIEGKTYREIIERHYFPPVGDWMEEKAERVVLAGKNEIQRMETKFYRVVRQNRRAVMYDELIKRLRKAQAVCEDVANDLGRPPRTEYAEAADAIEALENNVEQYKLYLQDAIKDLQSAHRELPRWIPVTERLPDCENGAEIGNVEWISHGRVYAGCFGLGGNWRDAYFRTWTDATEGIDAKDAECWRIVSLPEPPEKREGE